MVQYFERDVLMVACFTYDISDSDMKVTAGMIPSLAECRNIGLDLVFKTVSSNLTAIYRIRFLLLFHFEVCWLKTNPSQDPRTSSLCVHDNVNQSTTLAFHWW